MALHDPDRVLIDVMAGIVDSEPIPELNRRFRIGAVEWEGAGGEGQMELLARRNGEALAYATLLMLQPEKLNWVRTHWIWL